MTRAQLTGRVKTWLRSNKDHFIAIAVVIPGLVLLLIVAAPYCSCLS